MNTIKTIALMTGLMLLLVFVGGALWGRNGMILFFGIGMIMNLVNYWFSDKIVLKMYGAREVTDREAPVLYSVTRELASRGRLPIPRGASAAVAKRPHSGPTPTQPSCINTSAGFETWTETRSAGWSCSGGQIVRWRCGTRSHSKSAAEDAG